MHPVRLSRRAAAVALSLLGAAAVAPAAEVPPTVSDGLKAIRSVGREGAGNEAAASGWKAVVAAGTDALVPTLAAFDGASPTAANWLRSAVDGIADGARKAKRPLPDETLKAFVLDTTRAPSARRVAFELYTEADRAAADKLLPTLIDDPSNELRYDAVAARLKAAGENPAKAELQTLFAAGRDKEQAERIAKLLEKHGEKPDLTRHFNYLTEWDIAGPFDGTGASGYAKTYPPETAFDAAARYAGKGGADVTWKYAQSDDPYGVIDLTKEIGKVKDAVAFAHAIVTVENDTPVEVRVTSPNAVQIFVNGVKVFGHEEYHHGDPFDQYVGKCMLKAGENHLVVKLCQDDEKEPWAQEWKFNARVCDATGGKVKLLQTVVKNGRPTQVIPGATKPAAKKDDKKEGK